ncbi:MAG: acyl-CoA carboxylase subunit beta, partial [Ilumatobacteraceae bacterium]
DEDAGNELVRALLGLLPSNNLDEAPTIPGHDDPERESPELDTLVPEVATKPYDMHEVLTAILDDGAYLELQERWAPNIICAFGRLDGQPVGVVANQPKHLAGTLDITAREKAARFVRTCDAFNIPLVVFEDVPGFLPGLAQEHEGIIRRGSKLLYAFAEATVPKVTVITRKAYGGAYVVMNSKHIGADANVAWPTAEIAVMGSEAAVNLIFRKELADAADPAAKRAELIADYQERFASPYQAATRGYIDDVIQPRQTRPWLIKALRVARTKRLAGPARKHGNIPL